jgi:hypothetical protein
MSDIAAVITGLVSLMTGYMTYRNEKQRIEQPGDTEPDATSQVQEGKQALDVVREGIQKHGDTNDQRTLAGFEAEPDEYADMLKKKLTNLAQQNEHFRAMLTDLPPRLPLLQQHMRGETLHNAEQEIMGKQGDHTQTMSAEKDIDGASQRIG